MSAPEDVREMVRRRYAEAATRSTAADHGQARAVENACCRASPSAESQEM